MECMPHNEPDIGGKLPLDMLTGDDNRRDTQRRSVLWPAILHINDHQFACKIKNFSLSGVKLKFDLPFKEGTKVKVEIPRHDITLRAETAWMANGELGVHFLETVGVVQNAFGNQASVLGIKGTHKVGVLGKEALG